MKYRSSDGTVEINSLLVEEKILKKNKSGQKVLVSVKRHRKDVKIRKNYPHGQMSKPTYILVHKPTGKVLHEVIEEGRRPVKKKHKKRTKGKWEKKT